HDRRGGIHRRGHCASRVARATATAEAQRSRTCTRGKGTGNTKAAIATATANALRQKTVRMRAAGMDRAGNVDHHVAADAASARVAADGSDDPGRPTRCAQRKSAIAATAADALRLNGDSLTARGRDIAGACDLHSAGSTPGTAAATQAQPGGTIRGKRARTSEATIAAATADTLSKDATGHCPGRCDRAGVSHCHDAGRVAGATGAAEARCDRRPCSKGTRNSKATVAAAATDALRQNADGTCTESLDRARVIDRHV